MKCRTVAKELPAYLANELSDRARARVERHLKHCAMCTAELRALERTDQLLGTLDHVEPRRDMVAHVMRHIEREQETVPAFKRFLTSLRERQPQLQHAAAYILLAGALVLMAYNYQARRQPPATHTASGLTGPDGKTAEVASPDTEGAPKDKPFVTIRVPRRIQFPSMGRRDPRPVVLTEDQIAEINREFERARAGTSDDAGDDDTGGRIPEIGADVRSVGTQRAPVQPRTE